MATAEVPEIIERVRKAFRGVTLGNGVGLYQSVAIDGHESEDVQAKRRAEDEKQDWSAIPTERLGLCDGGPSFFDAEGMRFHLPAYIIADLQGRLAGLHDPVFHLTHLNEFAKSKLTLLSKPQRTAVRDYLLHVWNDPGKEHKKTRVFERALAEYWVA